ncbi:hypothetical protein SDJN03_21309, partial [Cucurbita argyrosperma subsp. sororia]
MLSKRHPMPLWLLMLYRNHPPKYKNPHHLWSNFISTNASNTEACQPPMQTDFSKMQNQEHCQQLWQDSHQHRFMRIRYEAAQTVSNTIITVSPMWKKPEEFALFEQQLKQEKLKISNHQLHSSLAGLSSTEVLPQPNILSKKLEVQSSSAVRELDCMRLQSKPSPVVIPACV